MPEAAKCEAVCRFDILRKQAQWKHKHDRFHTLTALSSPWTQCLWCYRRSLNIKYCSMYEWILWTVAFHVLPLAGQFSLFSILCKLIAIFPVQCQISLSFVMPASHACKQKALSQYYFQHCYTCHNIWEYSPIVICSSIALYFPY